MIPALVPQPRPESTKAAAKRFRLHIGRFPEGKGKLKPRHIQEFFDLGWLGSRVGYWLGFRTTTHFVTKEGKRVLYE